MIPHCYSPVSSGRSEWSFHLLPNPLILCCPCDSNSEVTMKVQIEDRLERLKRKYSHFGEIHDYDKGGSKDECRMPWNIAKIIVLERDGYRCRICGDSPIISENTDTVDRLRVEVEVHHIVPRIAGGTDSTKNLITLCKACHIKTFKNDYSGLPIVERRLDESVKVLTNSKALLKYGNKCQHHRLNSFSYRNTEIELREALDCEICDFPSLKKVYDIIFEMGLDFEEIIIKDKKDKYCVGIIEKNYSL